MMQSVTTAPLADPVAPTSSLVVLVHGFMRTGFSMVPLAFALRSRGFEVRVVSQFNFGSSIPELADGLWSRVEKLRDAAKEQTGECPTIHFVTHSMGGVVVRSMLSRHGSSGVKRVVMLAPPNRGSRLAAHVHDHILRLPWGGFDPLRKLLPGERGECANAGDPDVEIGIVAGAPTRAFSFPWALGDYVRDGRFSFAPANLGQHDGKVALDEVDTEGAVDLVVVQRGHSFMMVMPEVVAHCSAFLREGRFEHGSSGSAPV